MTFLLLGPILARREPDVYVRGVSDFHENVGPVELGTAGGSLKCSLARLPFSPDYTAPIEGRSNKAHTI
jgi:hypothetical protein